jgi:hypothetical protein
VSTPETRQIRRAAADAIYSAATTGYAMMIHPERLVNPSKAPEIAAECFARIVKLITPSVLAPPEDHTEKEETL